MRPGSIIPIAVMLMVVVRIDGADLQRRLDPLGTKMQQIVDETTRAFGNPKYSAELMPKQIFLHGAIVTNIHSRYLQTLIILWQNAETDGDKENGRKALAMWTPTIRSAVVAGQKFIRDSQDRAFSGAFHGQMREAKQVYDELITLLEDVSIIVEKKG